MPITYNQAVTSDDGALWEDSMDREWWGILGARTVEAAVYQSVENYTNAKWVYNWKADEFGWPTTVSYTHLTLPTIYSV